MKRQNLILCLIFLLVMPAMTLVLSSCATTPAGAPAAAVDVAPATEPVASAPAAGAPVATADMPVAAAPQPAPVSPAAPAMAAAGAADAAAGAKTVAPGMTAAGAADAAAGAKTVAPGMTAAGAAGAAGAKTVTAPAAPAAPTAAQLERAERLRKAKLAAEEKARLDAEAFAQRTLFINQNPRFDFDSYAIRDDAEVILKDKAEYMTDNPGLIVEIQGYCDERGTDEYNLALGDRRAKAVKKFMESAGIKSIRMDTISYGEASPVNPGHDEDAWAENRRVQFAIIGGEDVEMQVEE